MSEQQLDLKEIISAINLCQQESQKYNTVANTLSKCALLVQSLLKQGEEQAASEHPTAPESNTEPSKENTKAEA